MGNLVSTQPVQCPKITPCPRCPICPSSPNCPTSSNFPPAPVCPSNPVTSSSSSQITDDIDSNIIINKTKTINSNDYVNEGSIVPVTSIITMGVLNNPISYCAPLFGEPTFYWEGLTQIADSNTIFSKITLKNVSYDKTNHTTILDKKYVLKVNGSTETNGLPTNYITFNLPITSTTDNSIFILTRGRDKWSNMILSVCNSSNIPTKVYFSSCNSTRDATGNTSFLGPFNQIALDGLYEWLEFPISLADITTYKKSDNTLTIALHAGPNCTDRTMIIAGIAVVPNYFGLSTIACINLHWNLDNNIMVEQSNSTWEKYTIISHGIWNDEFMAHLDNRKKYKIKFPVLSNTHDIFLGIITHNNTWYDTSVKAIINSKTYYFSPLLTGRFGFSVNGRGVYRYARGIYLKKSEIIFANSNDNFIEVIIDLLNEEYSLHLRGLYSEKIYETLT